jgi:hypothetical protein
MGAVTRRTGVSYRPRFNSCDGRHADRSPPISTTAGRRAPTQRRGSQAAAIAGYCTWCRPLSLTTTDDAR